MQGSALTYVQKEVIRFERAGSSLALSLPLAVCRQVPRSIPQVSIIHRRHALRRCPSDQQTPECVKVSAEDAQRQIPFVTRLHPVAASIVSAHNGQRLSMPVFGPGEVHHAPSKSDADCGKLATSAAANEQLIGNVIAFSGWGALSVTV